MPTPRPKTERGMHIRRPGIQEAIQEESRALWSARRVTRIMCSCMHGVLIVARQRCAATKHNTGGWMPSSEPLSISCFPPHAREPSRTLFPAALYTNSLWAFDAKTLRVYGNVEHL